MPTQSGGYILSDIANFQIGSQAMRSIIGSREGTRRGLTRAQHDATHIPGVTRPL